MEVSGLWLRLVVLQVKAMWALKALVFSQRLSLYLRRRSVVCHDTSGRLDDGREATLELYKKSRFHL